MMIICIMLTLIIIAITWKKCLVWQNKIEINHICCFSLGYIFYCIIPVILFEIIQRHSDSLYNELSRIYSDISLNRKIEYLIISMVFYLSFIVGEASSRRFKITIGNLDIFKYKQFDFNKIQKISFIPVFILGVYLIYQNRFSWGLGYMGESYASASLSAYELLLNAFVMLYLSSNNERLKVKKLMVNKWVIWFALYSALLLTTGGRLYVVTCILSEVIFYSCIKGHGVNLRRVVLLFVILLIGIGSVGMIRLGVRQFSFFDVVNNIFSETIFTSWSGLTYVQKYSAVRLFGSIKMVFSNMINIVPSFLFTNKTKYMYSVLELYPKVSNPGGAAHFFLTFDGGCGIIPSIIFFFLLGRILGRMYRKIKEGGYGTAKAIYCLVSANLLFTLYRDPFATSVIKNIIEFSILVPFFITCIGKLIKCASES